MVVYTGKALGSIPGVICNLLLVLFVVMVSCHGECCKLRHICIGKSEFNNISPNFEGGCICGGKEGGLIGP